MAAGNDKPGNKPPQGPPDGGPRDGVRHDARGNAVWQWAVDTGKHAIDSTSRLLKRLEVPGLSLEDEATPGGKSRTGKVIPTGGGGTGGDKSASAGTGAGAGPARVAAKPERVSGYDPYGTRAGAKGPAARPAVRPAAGPAAAVRKPAATPPVRPSFWRRLFRRG